MEYSVTQIDGKFKSDTRMNYRSFDDLYKTVVRGAEKLPDDIDLVVGVPRSGLLPANILALYRNLPMTDLEGLAEKRLISYGNRLKKFGGVTFEDIKKVLILDDSSISGRAITKVKAFVKEKNLDTRYEIVYGVVFTTKKTHHMFDVYFGFCPVPRVFDWNIFHHDNFLKNSCVSIDGVLCRHPTDEENVDDEKYKNYLLNIPAKLVPKETIGSLVTNRLEKYRPETEAWLNKNNIRYNKLYMSQPNMKDKKKAASNEQSHKSNIYTMTKAQIFIESSYDQAKAISRKTGRQVYCTDRLTMVMPSGKKALEVRVNFILRKIFKRLGL